jgi:hypothetical protein
LPDISALNGTPIDSVAEFDGLTVPSRRPAAAYSVRLLGSAVGISSYTGDCMRVRRASDNVEADVGFDAGELKLTSPISNTSDAQSYTDLADFVDHTGTPTNAFVRYWYDQSPNANDAGQATAGNQLKVYDATTGLITANGKPAVKPVDLFGAMEFTMDRSSGEYSMFFVGQAFQRSTIFAGGGTSANYVMGAISGSTSNVNGNLQNTSLFVDGSASSIATSGDAYTAFLNNQSLITLFADHTWTTDDLVIAYVNQFTGGYQNQELIIYTNDQSSNRTAIESKPRVDYLHQRPKQQPHRH